jgi:transmembrane sensor
MNKQQLIELLIKYNVGTLDSLQKAKLESWYLQQAKNATSELTAVDAAQSMDRLRSKLPLSYPKPAKKLWPRIAVAASILIIATTGLLLFRQSKTIIPQNLVYQNDIDPGINNATLTLANGKKISLDTAAHGQMAREQGVLISKTADGKLVYKIMEAVAPTMKFNILETSKGQQSQIELPDGSKVWLNAASKLKFPTHFIGQDYRTVELEGEAYFEVAKDKQHPFIVRSAQQEITVLGTHFNVSSYADDDLNKTTLIEGSVLIKPIGKLSHNTSVQVLPMKPGDQAISNGSSLKVIQVDTEPTIAWKNNKFMFERQKIKEVMKMIERWYDIEVVYQGDVPEDYFTGSMSKFNKISTVFDLLELTGNIHFKIEGRRVTIMK